MGYTPKIEDYSELQSGLFTKESVLPQLHSDVKQDVSDAQLIREIHESFPQSDFRVESLPTLRLYGNYCCEGNIQLVLKSRIHDWIDNIMDDLSNTLLYGGWYDFIDTMDINTIVTLQCAIDDDNRSLISEIIEEHIPSFINHIKDNWSHIKIFEENGMTLNGISENLYSIN